MTMMVVETNAVEVSKWIEDYFNSVGEVVEIQSERIQDEISSGILHQFDFLGHLGAIPVLGGDVVKWRDTAEMTKNVRKADDYPEKPVMNMSGTIRTALEMGTVITTIVSNGGTLSFIPTASQQPLIDKHERGFEVTQPMPMGRYSPPRPMLFWGHTMADSVVGAVGDGLKKLAKKKGF